MHSPFLFPSVYLALPPDLAEDVAVVVGAAIQVEEEEEEEGEEEEGEEEEEIEPGIAEVVGEAAARFFQGPWQGPVHAQSQVTASGRR